MDHSLEDKQGSIPSMPTIGDLYLPGYQSLAVEFVGGMMSEIIIAAIEVVAVNLESCNFHPTFEQPWEMDNLVPISHAGD
jgi:hypothetical protein